MGGIFLGFDCMRPTRRVSKLKEDGMKAPVCNSPEVLNRPDSPRCKRTMFKALVMYPGGKKNWSKEWWCLCGEKRIRK